MVELEIKYADGLALFARGIIADGNMGEACGEMADCIFRIRECSRGDAAPEEAMGLAVETGPAPTTIIL